MDAQDRQVLKYYSINFPSSSKVIEQYDGPMKRFDWSLLDQIGTLEDKIVLNEGCFYPYDEISLAHKAKKWVSVDFSEKTISECKKLVEGVQFEVQDIRKLPYSDNYFDVVLSFSTIDHVRNGRDLVQKEVNRVLKPGGFYIITVPNLDYPEFKRESGDFGYCYCYTPTELKNELINAGFDILFFDDMTHNLKGPRMGCICVNRHP